MSGAGDERLYVSSWGWHDFVDPATGRLVRWRRWSVSWRNERKLILTLPAEVRSVEALVIAHHIAEGEGWE